MVVVIYDSLENTSQRAYPIKHRVRGGLGCVGCCICTDAEGGVARIRGWLVREGNEVVEYTEKLRSIKTRNLQYILHCETKTNSIS